MKKYWIIGLCVLTACGGEKKEEPKNMPEDIRKVEVLEKSAFNSNSMVMDGDTARALISAYTGFAAKYPKEKQTADYLFRAGDVAGGLGLHKDALSYYEKLYREFPDHSLAPTALFMQAYIYETRLGGPANLEIAKKLYSEFIQKYPGHSMADDAQASIEYLGKSPEEIMKMIEERNAKESGK